MKISACLSIFNRSDLLAQSLKGYLWQTMPACDWEIVLVDDMSTEDLSKVYAPYIGKINIRHVRIDHTQHIIWKRRNKAGAKPLDNWYHTPCITTNIGAYLAKGDILALCHPEVLHSPWNFERALKHLDEGPSFLFGNTYLGTPEMTERLLKATDWTREGWYPFLAQMGAPGGKLERLDGPYWYTSFLPKIAMETIGGCDFTYMDGVAGEDDDLRERAAINGWLTARTEDIQGFHPDHTHETDPHRQRDTVFWNDGLVRNRSIYQARKTQSGFPMTANQCCDWTAKECIMSVREYTI